MYFFEKTRILTSRVFEIYGVTKYEVNGDKKYDDSYYSVAGIGDINNDSFNDFAIAVPSYSCHTGVVYIIYGFKNGSYGNINLENFDNRLGIKITFSNQSPNTPYSLGVSIKAAGDVNGDGYQDIIIGAPASSSAMGIFGPAGCNFHSDDYLKFKCQGASYIIFGGKSLSNVDLSAGDIDLWPKTQQHYSAYPKYFTLYGPSTQGAFGSSVSYVGDFDGDATSDVLVRNFASGDSYLIFGSHIKDLLYYKTLPSIRVLDLSKNTKNTGVGFCIKGASEDWVGSSPISHAGDFNGDGYDDIIVGQFGEEQKEGRALLLFGTNEKLLKDANLDCKEYPGINIKIKGYNNYMYDSIGFSVNAAGDLNNDTFDDIIIGSYYTYSWPATEDYNSVSYILLGNNHTKEILLSPDGTNDENVIVIYGKKSSGLGYSASSGGDINGDGYPDIIIGAHETNNFKGIVYVIFGKKEFLPILNVSEDNYLVNSGQGFEIIANDAEVKNGISISAVGDLNGDGCDDIIVGTATEKIGAYVIYGSKTFAENIFISDAQLVDNQNKQDKTYGFLINGVSFDNWDECLEKVDEYKEKWEILNKVQEILFSHTGWELVSEILVLLGLGGYSLHALYHYWTHHGYDQLQANEVELIGVPQLNEA